MTPEELRELRKSFELTQVEFGRLLGFKSPNKTISNMETGDSPITPQTRHLCLYIKKYGILPELVKELKKS